MRNHSILFFTDNEALVHVINKQSCRDKVLMVLVRKLMLVCLEYNILFKAKHIPGTHNILADSLSRLQVQTIQAAGTIKHESFSYRHSPALAASKLGDIITHLTKSSLQPSSIPTYVRAWKMFTQFHSICFRLHVLHCQSRLLLQRYLSHIYSSPIICIVNG